MKRMMDIKPSTKRQGYRLLLTIQLLLLIFNVVLTTLEYTESGMSGRLIILCFSTTIIFYFADKTADTLVRSSIINSILSYIGMITNKENHSKPIDEILKEIERKFYED